MWEEAWERAVEAALHAGGKGSSSPARSLTLDDAVKCIHGRVPAADILERHQSLEHLSIAGVGVTSLEGFPRLRNLTRLTLSDNRIAGGLDHLVAAGLFSLRALDVSNNCIQDVDDLTPLADLRLMSLDLYGCPVTRAKDYRSRVFGMIRTLKYLDKMMDADENERPVSEMGKATTTKDEDKNYLVQPIAQPQAMAIGSDFDAAPDDADEDREEVNDDCEGATDQPSSSQRTKRKRDDSPPKSSSSSSELLKKRKRATKSNIIEEAAASASPVTKESSSAVSLPLRCPYIPRTVKGVDSFGREILEPFVNIDSSILSAYRRLRGKYYAKKDRIMKLHSMDQNVPPSCLVDPDLLPVRSSATKTVLRIAKVVLSLSSYLDGLPLARSSGFLIDWDADSKIGIILTSAFLIRSKSPSIDEWLARDVYEPHAEVCVHLLDKDDTNVIAELVFYDKHYNIALFKAVVDLHAQIPPFSSEVNCAQEVFILGRDESRNLSIDHGSVEYKDPSDFKRYHYMYVNCGIKQLVIGGPVINFDGEIMGMASHPQTAFMPSSIILKCLHMWKKFNCIPRLHIGMKFSVIIFMDPSLIEKISRKCGTDAGLVVTQVSEGSVAEKYGIGAGDIIKYWNGEKISTTVELENFLLCLCEEHLDKGNIIGSTVDISIDILHVRKDFNDTIKLTANVSKDVEIIAEGTYAVTSKDCAPEHHDDEVYGEEAYHGISHGGDGDTTSIPFRKETEDRDG